MAEKIANQSLILNKKLKNYIVQYKKFAIMYIYNKPADSVYKVYIDNDDVEKISKYKWYINKPQNARTLYVASDKVGKLHRFILNVTDKTILIDHINRNGLNNKKNNLRKVNNSINKKNMKVRVNNKFGVNGISFDKSKNVFRVIYTDLNYKRHDKNFNINKYGSFELALEAAKIFRKKKEKENGYK